MQKNGKWKSANRKLKYTFSKCCRIFVYSVWIYSRTLSLISSPTRHRFVCLSICLPVSVALFYESLSLFRSKFVSYPCRGRWANDSLFLFFLFLSISPISGSLSLVAKGFCIYICFSFFSLTFFRILQYLSHSMIFYDQFTPR